MASRREIAITIKGNLSAGNDEAIGYSRTANSAVSSDDTIKSAMSSYSKTGGRKASNKTLGTVIAVYAAKETLSTIIRTASMAWNRHVDMKEDYLGQNNVSEFKAHLGAIKSYASSAMTGASMGARYGGVVGAVIGAAVGTVGNAANRVINFAQAKAGYAEQNNAMNAQTNFSRVRMGLMDGGRGTEN